MTGDPFYDPEFRDRLGKLLRLLASDHAEEADTARRKLLAALAQHDLSAHDLADRLAGPAGDEQTALRSALRHAEQRAFWAESALRRAEAGLVEQARTPGRSRAVWVGLASALVAAPCAAVVALVVSNARSTPPARPPPSLPPLALAPDAGTPAPPGSVAGGTTMFSASGAVREVRRPEGWAGAVLSNGTELRESVVAGAPVRTVLAAGSRVLVSGTVVHDGVAWLQVETESGPGFVLASRVERAGRPTRP